jgi:hypothetical protein
MPTFDHARSDHHCSLGRVPLGVVSSDLGPRGILMIGDRDLQSLPQSSWDGRAGAFLRDLVFYRYFLFDSLSFHGLILTRNLPRLQEEEREGG